MTERFKKIRELHDKFWNKPFRPIDKVPEPIIRIAKRVNKPCEKLWLLDEVLRNDANGIDTTESKKRLKELNEK
jgi:hypothetical protein